jgi:O-acetyl-ADP-ribose deacetylase (regulator of RNase III)
MSLVKKIIEKVFPIWREHHYIHSKPNFKSTTIKEEFENPLFLQTLNQIEKYSEREILYVLLNTLKIDLPKDIQTIIDELYEEEKTPPFKIANYVSKKIVIWKGDITSLKIDGIVNAANSYLEGCFIPFHKCIDNVIHTKAGPKLREECRSWKCKYEAPGNAKLSKAYHLPCKYILHTVGPIYDSKVDKSQELKSCYESCLNLGNQNNINSLAFCCISTGEFGYPVKEATTIACNTIKEYMMNNSQYDYDFIVLNVFKQEDLECYKQIAPSIFGENNIQLL